MERFRQYGQRHDERLADALEYTARIPVIAIPRVEQLDHGTRVEQNHRRRFCSRSS
jgi:hypothetical protein